MFHINRYKDRGNDYFKVQEYDTALIEYNKCIEMFPTANGYNNRAIARNPFYSYFHIKSQ